MAEFLVYQCGFIFFFFSSRRRHTRFDCDWSSDVCSSDLWGIEDCKSRNGTLVNGVPVERSPLADGDLIELGQSFLIFREGVAGSDAPAVAEVDHRQGAAPGLATLSAELAGEFERLQTMARSRVPVVVRGESGTGKEMIAWALHCLSGRTGTLQAVNCGSLPSTLVESELFGFRKGAFSGATEDRPGLVQIGRAHV